MTTGTWTIGLAIQTARKMHGLEPHELADRLGWHPSKLSRIENDRTKRGPSLEELRQLREELGQDWAWYLEGPTVPNGAMGRYLNRTRELMQTARSGMLSPSFATAAI